MKALIPMICLCLGGSAVAGEPEQEYETMTGEAQAPLARTIHPPRVRLGVAINDEQGGEDARAFGLEQRVAIAATAEVLLAPFAPSWLAAEVGISNRTGSADAGLDLGLVEGQLGVTASYADHDFLSFITPYARVSALLGWARLSLGDSYSDSKLVPGVEAALGARFDWLRRARTQRSILFGFTDFSYAWRATPSFSLHVDDDAVAGNGDLPAPISGPATPIGDVGLSAWAWRIGVGLQF